VKSAGRLVEVEPSCWDEVARRAGVSDVYYSRGFVEASAVLVDGRPAFLHLAGDGGDVLFPCLVRRDPADVVTPYGYGGPLGTGPEPPFAEFADQYQAWCRARDVVTSFVVFHPLFGNARAAVLDGVHRSALAGTVAWPLADPDLLGAMHRHHRRAIRRAGGLEVAVEPSPADLAAFVELYEQTMRRAGAAAFYLFPPPYWQALLRLVPLVRVDVRDRGELVAGVLGMGRPPWRHYHRGASGRRPGASHLALYHLARWGQEHGYDTLHLGGGVGGRDDSLLEFKLRFAPNGRVDSFVGKVVHDPARYARLTGRDAIDWNGFFPAYRARG
jgi:serine/alanine adding enzyme